MYFSFNGWEAGEGLHPTTPTEWSVYTVTAEYSLPKPRVGVYRNKDCGTRGELANPHRVENDENENDT